MKFSLRDLLLVVIMALLLRIRLKRAEPENNSAVVFRSTTAMNIRHYAHQILLPRFS